MRPKHAETSDSIRDGDFAGLIRLSKSALAISRKSSKESS
jgi:hypothetical protein